MSTARDYLAAVQQRADAATNGRWVYGGQGWVFAQAVSIGDGELRDLLAQVRTNDADAEFIAGSRTDVPALVAALTAALDGQPAFIPTPPGPQRAVRDTDLRNAGIAEGWRQARAAITDALTPKENDS